MERLGYSYYAIMTSIWDILIFPILIGLATKVSSISDRSVIFYLIMFPGLLGWAKARTYVNKHFGWSQKLYKDFWLIESQDKIGACGELINCQGESRTTSYSYINNVFVIKSWRCRGIGSFLIQHLIDRAIRPIYLHCTDDLTYFYNKLGFYRLPPQQIPQWAELVIYMDRTGKNKNLRLMCYP
jgi:GNAT superfamily N-acetyltransferase